MTAHGSRFLREYRHGLLLLLPILFVMALLLFFPARWEGALRMDAIHRALSSFGGPFSHCSRSARSDVAIGRPKPTIFLSAALLRLPAWAGNTRGSRGCNSWMVSGSQWRLFWPAGYTAHVGRRSAHTHLLAVLGVKGETQPVRHTFGIPLAIAVVLVAWTGYRGGQLSLGAAHLTEHMPARLRHVLGVSDRGTVSSKVDPNTFYGARVQPIFAARCVNCHGPDKHKADLRLDTYQGVMRGGKDGPVVQAGNAKGSDLFRRITLPVNHDDFMPKDGKKPLSSDQVKLIELWIGAGASETLAKDAIKNAPGDSSSSNAVAEIIFPEADPAAVLRNRSAIAPEVIKLQKRFPNILDYESRSSANLRLNASILGTKFGDSDLAAFGAVAGHITVADFSRTNITDHSAGTIAGMKRLRVLRLASTGITDDTLQRLGALDQLESLNVFGTQVTSAALPAIAKLPKLAHLYAGQTSISQGSVVPEGLAGKLVF